jgi:hypothetical protein
VLNENFQREVYTQLLGGMLSFRPGHRSSHPVIADINGVMSPQENFSNSLAGGRPKTPLQQLKTQNPLAGLSIVRVLSDRRP